MTLLYTEGFDWLATADMDAGYGAWGEYGGSSMTIESGREDQAVNFVASSNTAPQTYEWAGITWGVADQTAGATLIWGFGFKINVAGGTDHIISVADSGSGVPSARHNMMLSYHTTGYLSVGIQTGGSGNEFTNRFATGTTPISTGVYYYVEIKFTPHASSGSIIVHLNGAEEINVSGIDTVNASNAWNAIHLGCQGNSGGTQSNSYDDLYICNTDGSTNNDFLGDIIVQTIKPNGNGTTSQLTGSDADSTDNYLHVDDGGAIDDDTSYVESGTSGQKDTYAYANTTTLGTVYAVNVKTIAKKTSAGALDLKAVARSGTTEGDSSALGFGTSYSMKPSIYETNPDTSSAWTSGEIDSAEFGIKIA